MKRLLFVAAVLLQVTAVGAQADTPSFPVLKGPYLGQKPPGNTPEVFAPGIVSTAAHEFSCSFTPDGREFYFARRDSGLNQIVVMVTRLRDSVWTKPEVAPFVENQFSFEPTVTPDNKRLYFSSGRSMPGQTGPAMNILSVERVGDVWGTAKDPGAPLNPGKAMAVSVAASGTIYTTDISGGPGKQCIAVSHRIGGQYRTLERMGPPIGGDAQRMYPFIAPDESYLVFTEVRPSDKIRNILLVSFRKADGSWGEPGPIDLGMEAALPFVSSDGKFLFFTSGERGKSDIYWVSAAVLDALRPKAKKTGSK
ncbi:MAG TPA: hypothetical protein VMU02_04975 [bacterium]|nr:hypothetical protein [bacterium]